MKIHKFFIPNTKRMFRFPFKSYQTKISLSPQNFAIESNPTYLKVSLKNIDSNLIKEKAFYFGIFFLTFRGRFNSRQDPNYSQ